MNLAAVQIRRGIDRSGEALPWAKRNGRAPRKSVNDERLRESPVERAVAADTNDPATSRPGTGFIVASNR